MVQIGFFLITWYVAESYNNPKSFLSYFSLSTTKALFPSLALRITMSSYYFDSSIARFSAFDRFGFVGLALLMISTTFDRAESIKHLLAKLI